MQAHTPQTDGRDEKLPHPPKLDFAEQTRESSGTRYPPPINYRNRSPERTEQPLQNRTNLSTPPTSHGTNPGDYRAKTKADLPRNHASSYDSTRYIRSETRHTPPEIDTKHKHPYRDRMETIPDSDVEQHLESRRTSERGDDERGRNRAEERRFSDTRNDHRKRRTATTKETIMWWAPLFLYHHTRIRVPPNIWHSFANPQITSKNGDSGGGHLLNLRLY